VDNDGDDALQFETLAAALRSAHKQAGDLLEYLAKMLEVSFPEGTKISRDGWFMSEKRAVKELKVSMGDAEYQITRNSKSSNFSARRAKIVRGVVLKTEEISLDDCIDEIVQHLAALAKKNESARKALERLVLE
jgi:hypothetical protein